MHCVVIGAGVAGIAATQALRRIGAQVSLLERDPVIRDSGYQLSILSNGRYALDQIGLLDALDTTGSGWPLTACVNIDGRTGRRLQEIPQHPDHGRYLGAAFFRSDVHRNLLGGLHGAGPEYGVTVREIVDGEPGPVVVRDAEGKRREADLVIVADGARSRLRDALPGHRRELRPWVHFLLASAHVDLDGGSEAERMFRDQAARHEFPQILYPGACVVLSYAGQGRVGLIVALPGHEVPSEPSGAEMKRLALRAVAGLREPRVHHAIAAACWDEADPEHRPMLLLAGDIEPLASYAHGRVALVGDCAHAMLPVLGQGANQSFEDAMVLGRCMGAAMAAQPSERSHAIRVGLARYSAGRAEHVTPIQRASRQVAGTILATGRARHALNCAAARWYPETLLFRQINHLLRYAIDDPQCPVEPLDASWLPNRWRLRSRRAAGEGVRS